MHIIATRESGDEYSIRPLTDGARTCVLGERDFLRRIAELEQEHEPRWVLPSTERLYPLLLAANVRLRRCHDLALTEGLLLAVEDDVEGQRGLAAAYARARGLPPPPLTADPYADTDQPALFETEGSGLPEGVTAAEAAAEVLAAQRRRAAEAPHAQRFSLLVAAESASALAAAEMSHDGLPWRAAEHRELLTTMLGPRVPTGQRPRTLAALTARIESAFGGRAVNPDAPASVLKAFTHAGIELPNTRAWSLREIDHPAVAPLLEYKELARLHSAHGWAWLDDWVAGDRFRPNYVVSGVVTGRWASRGGAALQIPRSLRVCVRPDPGWRLVVADAAQLEPRVLAALAGDRKLAEVSASTDLYDSLATAMFGSAAPAPDGTSNRNRAKIGMLSAMYGGTAGEASSLLALLRRRFPDAVSYVEGAANAGERGERVRSRLGRTSPSPSSSWRALTGGATEDAAVEGKARQASRGWGRFTRNFVVQATAADWTAVLLAVLRRRLPAPAQLVFFQHDEVIVHAPADLADEVAELIDAVVAEVATLVFGPSCPVRFPMHIAAVDRYADAK